MFKRRNTFEVLDAFKMHQMQGARKIHALGNVQKVVDARRRKKFDRSVLKVHEDRIFFCNAADAIFSTFPFTEALGNLSNTHHLQAPTPQPSPPPNQSCD